ncbi:Dabb family protein [Streptomyces torulosus]|uniref:Dabb family protein n=1 Tax=Streptomyces torulosus TaxID=68276 RepID=UPI0006EB78C6|nr:Dabb family protein [Streptomyces torulosus]
MIRHVVLFRFKPGIDWNDPRAVEAEQSTAKVGSEVPGLHAWRCGRNVSTRAVAYDFYAEGVLDDIPAVDRYLTHPFHRRSAELWREIADWVVVDVEA